VVCRHGRSLGKRKGPAFHESSGKTGYPTPHWSVSDCATHGSGRVSHGVGIGPQNRKNEGTRGSCRMGHHPRSSDGSLPPDSGCREGSAQQRGEVIHRLRALKRGTASRASHGSNAIQNPASTPRCSRKNLKLFPVPPELGENYNQYQKEFSELFRYRSFSLQIQIAFKAFRSDHPNCPD